MTYSSTIQLWRRGAQASGKNRQGFRKLLPAYRQWEVMKSLLNRLVINQTLGPISLIYAKELQQYAEELVTLGKVAARNPINHRASSLVESMLKSSEARDVLYEHLVPRYSTSIYCNRHSTRNIQLYTRVVNTWTFRERDTTPLGIIEFVERPGELLPVQGALDPREVGEGATRRERRARAQGRAPKVASLRL